MIRDASDPEAELAAAVEKWFADTSDVPVVATSFYVIAAGPGFESDGDDTDAINQYWRGGPVEQLGLLGYATQHARRRVFASGDDDR